ALPQRQAEGRTALALGHAGQAVFAPPGGSGQRKLGGRTLPARLVGRLMLADGGPLPLAQIPARAFATAPTPVILSQAACFRVEPLRHGYSQRWSSSDAIVARQASVTQDAFPVDPRRSCRGVSADRQASRARSSRVPAWPAPSRPRVGRTPS